ncbi:uncharacterized protein LOC109813856 [Cajanus cajan]|uniref:uncharacterized protein LOC109813856 n=1 Tax=Cajanus cajan TaxID=3821 RepID=UPI00098D9DDE|nr:uncharacterized protein LOC109813856 [Cajanus cajan]
MTTSEVLFALTLSLKRPDDFGGWALPHAPAHSTVNKPPLIHPNSPSPSYALLGFGTSLALLLAVFAASRRGFHVPFARPLQGLWTRVETRRDQNDTPESDVSAGTKSTVSENSVAVTETGRCFVLFVFFIMIVITQAAEQFIQPAEVAGEVAEAATQAVEQVARVAEVATPTAEQAAHAVEVGSVPCFL